MVKLVKQLYLVIFELSYFKFISSPNKDLAGATNGIYASLVNIRIRGLGMSKIFGCWPNICHTDISDKINFSTLI